MTSTPPACDDHGYYGVPCPECEKDAGAEDHEKDRQQDQKEFDRIHAEFNEWAKRYI